MTDPYAEYIRILGRGPTKSRHLTQEEAYFAFSGLLSGEMADLQVGALLLLLRYRSESPEELAGIVSAIRDYINHSPVKTSDEFIDWPSYASGKSRRLPWFLLSAKLLAENGLKIFMHGFNSHLENGLLTEDCLWAVGEAPVSSLAEAQKKLEADGFSYLPLRNFCPKLQEALEIRSVLGVRSIVNTAVKLINPLGAKLIFLGIFHPAYIALNIAAGNLLNQPGLGVIKGGGGEAERNIQKSIKLYQIKEKQEQVTNWPPDIRLKGKQDYPVTAEYLAAVWQGKLRDEYAAGMIIGTAAQALYLTGRAATVDEAENMGRSYWQNHLDNI